MKIVAEKKIELNKEYQKLHKEREELRRKQKDRAAKARYNFKRDNLDGESN
jgi:hypothetical protein